MGTIGRRALYWLGLYPGQETNTDTDTDNDDLIISGLWPNGKRGRIMALQAIIAVAMLWEGLTSEGFSRVLLVFTGSLWGIQVVAAWANRVRRR